MISVKILSTAAALALLVPMTVSTANSAEVRNGGRAAVGGAAFHAGGAPARSFAAPAAMARPGGGAAGNGGGAPAARFAATAPAAAPTARFNGGGGVYRGQYGGGYRRDRDRDGRFWPGAAVAGAVVGGAIAADSYAYYGGPGYYDAPAYYDDQYADDGVVAMVPAPVGDDASGYCAQRYRSYDPASGTYLGNDGYRHPCP